MKKQQTIESRILKYQTSIDKFRSDTTLDQDKKRNAIFTLQSMIRELKWVLKK